MTSLTVTDVAMHPKLGTTSSSGHQIDLQKRLFTTGLLAFFKPTSTCKIVE